MVHKYPSEIHERQSNIIENSGDFSWAVKQLKEGEKIRRKGWINQKFYVYSNGITIVDSNKNSEFKFYLVDFEATDWTIFKSSTKFKDLKLGDKFKYCECEYTKIDMGGLTKEFKIFGFCEETEVVKV